MSSLKRGLSSEQIGNIAGGIVGKGNTMLVDSNGHIIYNALPTAYSGPCRAYGHAVYDNTTGKRVAIFQSANDANRFDVLYNPKENAQPTDLHRNKDAVAEQLRSNSEGYFNLLKNSNEIIL